MQAGLKPTLACAKAFATTDFRPELTSFRCRTLIIHGTADKTVPIDAAGPPRSEGNRQLDLEGVRRRTARSFRNEQRQANRRSTRLFTTLIGAQVWLRQGRANWNKG